MTLVAHAKDLGNNRLLWLHMDILHKNVLGIWLQFQVLCEV